MLKALSSQHDVRPQHVANVPARSAHSNAGNIGIECEHSGGGISEQSLAAAQILLGTLTAKRATRGASGGSEAVDASVLV